MANSQNLTAPKFQPGKSGNPGGKTSEQRKAEVEAAEKAALIQAEMLDALAQHVAEDPKQALESIKADPLKLIKDAMDRAHGQPTQPLDHNVGGGARKLNAYLDTIAERQSGGEAGEPTSE